MNVGDAQRPHEAQGCSEDGQHARRTGEEERFAAAVECGRTRPLGMDDGTATSHASLEIVAMLRSAVRHSGRDPPRERGRSSGSWPRFAEQHGIGHADDTGPVQVIAPVAVAEPPTERHAEPTPLRARHGGRHSAPAEAADDEGTALAETVEPDLGPDVRRLRRNRPERVRAPAGRAAAVRRPPVHSSRWPAGHLREPGRAARRPMYGVKRVAESTG